ncbi:hypothetical protein Misp01_11340 [Microtetraspora sp. NBRC 13810]|uniref:hypothetical protein n=1 Tax=Microtetraspora sp. NBRC 13810 TaxID=3030990 RepID=UPI0024A2F93D|nr:hypothetical protein [Microtetraspora sp. NBRC 13810]GLW06004.1 hypothetical protein Misp01_11340 [Microtetraspora sp. NBRC 13810]
MPALDRAARAPMRAAPMQSLNHRKDGDDGHTLESDAGRKGQQTVTNNQAGKSSLQVAEILFSPLFTLDELGPLGQIAITCSVKEKGCSHSPSCRQRGKHAAEPTTTSLKEFREHRHHERVCRTCGGADLPALSPEEIASVEKLASLLPPRLEAAQRRAEAERVVVARVRAADALDERARAILDGWEWRLAEERQRLKDDPPMS